MTCKVCGGTTAHVFNHIVLASFEASYYRCPSCGFLQTSDPVWLEAAYEEAMNMEDTGLVSRNIQLRDTVSVLIYFCLNRRGRYLDFGGGHGLYVRIMRDAGFDFRWYDPHAENLFARGFEYDWDGPVVAVTAFECFEHFTDPLATIEHMLSVSSTMLFTTAVLPEQTPSPAEWGYYGFTHGQHIAFYSSRTLRRIADRFGLNYFSIGVIHVLTDRRWARAHAAALRFLIRARAHVYVRRRMASKTTSDMRHVIAVRSRQDSA